MIGLFRRIRRKLANENRFLQYSRYAIGEIVLVMVGILLALQVNNWNINRAEKTTEIKYLKNIKIDLKKDMVNIDRTLKFRRAKLIATQKVIENINGLPIENLTELTKNIMNTLYTERFQPSNITYNDLVSSGSLKLISNDSIKLLLLELSLLYQNNEFYIEHESSGYEEYLSKPIYKFTDIARMKPVFLGIKTVEPENVREEDFMLLFESVEYKNGCVGSIWVSEGFIVLYQKIETKSKRIVELIDIELKN